MPNLDEVEKIREMEALEQYKSSLHEITRNIENICEYKKELKKENFKEGTFFKCDKECPYGNREKVSYGPHEGFYFCKTKGLIKNLKK